MRKLLIFCMLLVFTGLLNACANAETPVAPTEYPQPPTPIAEPPQDPGQPYELTEYISYKAPQKLHVYTPTGV